jgi:acyl-CoA thioesterase
MEVEAGLHLMNPHGVMHGAVLFAAMDTAMGGAVTSVLTEGETCTTVEAKVNYLGAVRSGRLTATATVVQKGSRIAVVEARATSDDGRLAGLMTGTFMILAPQRS